MLTTESATRKDLITGKASMEHRHFATVATIIRQADCDQKTRDYMTNLFCNELAQTNPRFDRSRFLRACLRNSD